MPMLDDGLDEESKRRKKADEDTTGMLLAIKRKERASEENRGPRPAIAKGLPLAAYSDDQLDEMAAWVRSDGVERSDLETAEELREALGITRRGFQSDAVLGNVVRRTKPAVSAQESDEASASDDAQPEESSDRASRRRASVAGSPATCPTWTARLIEEGLPPSWEDRVRPEDARPGSMADAPDRGDGANDARLLENVPPHAQARA